jgi:hypothetical protein
VSRDALVVQHPLLFILLIRTVPDKSVHAYYKRHLKT